MKIKLLLFSLVLITTLRSAVGAEKKIWAKSFMGKPAPNLEGEAWISDKPSIKKGQYVLIDFWATWCGPCRKAIPDLNKWHKEFSEKLVVIGISAEKKEKVIKMKSPKVQYYSAVDSHKVMSKQLGIKGVPHVIIINPKGIVVWEGYPLLEGDELTSQVIKDLLKN